MNFFETGKYALITLLDLLKMLIGGLLLAIALPAFFATVFAGAVWVFTAYARATLFPGPSKWSQFWEAYAILRNRQEHALNAGFPGRWPNAGRAEALRIAFRNTFTDWK